MIIPDGHNEPKKEKKANPTPTSKRHRGSDVYDGDIPDAYQKKVNAALEKMTDGQRIRIDRVCKPENREMFIEAIKRFITSRPYGGGITFNSDWSGFYKSDVSWIDKSNRSNAFGDERSKRISEQRSRRNAVIRFWRQTLKHDTLTKFCHNSAEYSIDDPVGTIESGITALKGATIGSHPFRAWLERMESLANAWQRKQGRDETFDSHNRPTVFDDNIKRPTKFIGATKTIES